MVFNTLTFLVFLCIVYPLYGWVHARGKNGRNVLIILASYVFYGWWDWRFLGLIVLSSSVDFWLGLKLGQTEQASRRKVLLGTSLLVNLGLLGYFKYANWFMDSLVQLMGAMGLASSISSLSIILPVGISFYTFQTLSYTLDVYHKRISPCQDLPAFFAFVSFFPQLVAGPIERASHLLTQFQEQRPLSYAYSIEGLRLFLWGMFKKVVIADNLAFDGGPDI